MYLSLVIGLRRYGVVPCMHPPHDLAFSAHFEDWGVGIGKRISLLMQPMLLLKINANGTSRGDGAYLSHSTHMGTQSCFSYGKRGSVQKLMCKTPACQIKTLKRHLSNC